MSLLLAAGGGGGPASYTLTAQTGTYSLSGGSAVLTVGRNLSASAGTYSIAGGTAVLSAGRKLTANAATYTVTGGSGVLSAGRTLIANAGAYSLSGGTATLVVARTVTANAGSYSLSGGSATLTKATAGAGTSYSLVGEAGVYAFIGGDAGLTHSTGPVGCGVTFEGWVLDGFGSPCSVSQAVGGGGRGKRKIYVEREGKILLFNSNAEAAAYVQAEKSLEKPQEAPKKATSKPKKVRKAPEPTVINVEALKAYFTAVQQPEVVEEITQALRLEDFELLIKLQEMWLAEEDDIETLLLVI